MNEQRRCDTHAHTHTVEYYLAIKEWNNVICSNMDGPGDYYTKWNQPDREWQIPYDIPYMWSLKYDTNELTYETETESLTTNLWLSKQKAGGGGIS